MWTGIVALLVVLGGGLQAFSSKVDGDQLDRIDLFKPADGQYPCYRQPLLLRAGTALLGFAEGRNVETSQCAPAREAGQRVPNEPGGLELRVSMDDGRHWGEQATVFSGNIDYYTAVWDAESNTVFLMVEGAGSAVGILTSTDFGKTWAGPTPLTAQALPPLKAAGKPSCGHGISITAELCAPSPCKHAGRLVLPFVCANATNSHPVACALLSDDHGKSWAYGGFAQDGARESTVVQTMTSSSQSGLYVNSRNMGTDPGHRFTARSADGGDTYGSFAVDTSLPTPVTPAWTGIVASVARLSMSPSKSRIIYIGASSPDTRADLEVRLSYDEGKTWAVSKTLFDGPAGYADATTLDIVNGVVGAIYENGEATFADRISFSSFNASWLED